MPQHAFFSPLGPLTITEEDDHIVSLDWGHGSVLEPTPLLEEAERQLEAYFLKALEIFDLPLKLKGTDFQMLVWEDLRLIPYGETATYGQIANQVGNAPRAVGQACGLNPIPIIIPCHRVLASDGSLGGYSGEGGVKDKKFLLHLEGVEV